MTKNPCDFWRHIKRLGPHKSGKIPWEIEEDGEIRTDEESVLRKWRTEFQKLYIAPDADKHDENVKREILNSPKHGVKRQCALELNKPLNYQEIKSAVEYSKLKKACGIDNVTNELLKSDEATELLYALFVKCFSTGMILDCWRKSVVNPIPKSSGYTTDPLKYRGLSLQSCVYKILSTVMNRRLMTYLEDSNELEEEQNGFRAHRSCLHHIFVLQTMIRHHCKSGRGLFCSFVDFRKAFDSIDRELLFHLLRDAGVDGKILSLMKQTYQDTVNTVRINNR